VLNFHNIFYSFEHIGFFLCYFVLIQRFWLSLIKLAFSLGIQDIVLIVILLYFSINLSMGNEFVCLFIYLFFVRNVSLNIEWFWCIFLFLKVYDFGSPTLGRF
jgi:hypothetical protein